MNYIYLERLVNSKKIIITHFLFPLNFDRIDKCFLSFSYKEKKRILQKSKENIHLIRIMLKRFFEAKEVRAHRHLYK